MSGIDGSFILYNNQLSWSEASHINNTTCCARLRHVICFYHTWRHFYITAIGKRFIIVADCKTITNIKTKVRLPYFRQALIFRAKTRVTMKGRQAFSTTRMNIEVFMWRYNKPILQVFILATCWFPFPTHCLYWKTQQNSQIFSFSSYHNTKCIWVTRVLARTLGWNLKSCYEVIQNKSMPCCFSPYRTVQKGNQGSGQNYAHINANRIMQTLYATSKHAQTSCLSALKLVPRRTMNYGRRQLYVM